MDNLKVILIDTKISNPNFYIIRSILWALQAHPKISSAELATYETLIPKISEHRPDLILAVDGENICVDIFVQVKRYGIPTALWCFEDPYEVHVTSTMASLFDFFFTNDPGSCDHYRPAAVHLPLAGSRENDYLAVRETDHEFEYDVSFIGSAWPNRVRFLRTLMARLPSLKWRINLLYNEHLPEVTLDLPRSDYVGSVSHQDFSFIANRSRIVLTLHRDFSGNSVNSRAKSPGPRIFEIALSGGFQLVDATDINLSGYFDTTEISTFSGVDDCEAKIVEFLRENEKRTKQASRAQTATLNRHLYEHRISTILETVKSQSRSTSIINNTRDRPTILFVTHNLLKNGNFGGVEVYQRTISETLRKNFRILFYSPAISTTENKIFVLSDSNGSVLESITTPNFDPWRSLQNDESEIAFANILVDYNIDLIHFHHIINHSPSLPKIAKILGVASIYTVQDYYLVCSKFNLLDYRGNYCETAIRPIEICDVCLKADSGIEYTRQNYRRSYMSEILNTFDYVICNTRISYEIIRGVFGDLTKPPIFIGLPAPDQVSTTIPHKLSRSTNELRVVFLGNFSKNKGAETFLRAADMLRGEAIEFFILGRIDDPYRTVIDGMHFKNVEVLGEYDAASLDLSSYDLSLHLSTWPETYCITLSEAWKNGLVPIVTHVGALGERVNHGHNGFIIPIDGVGELVELLRRLSTVDRSELSSLKARITPDLWLTPTQHCVTLLEVYNSLLRNRPLVSLPPVRLRDIGAPLTLRSVLGRSVNPGVWTDLIEQVAPVSLLREQAAPSKEVLLSKKIFTRVYEGEYINDYDISINIEEMVLKDYNSTSSRYVKEYAIAVDGDDLYISGWLRFDKTLVGGQVLLVTRSIDGQISSRELTLLSRADVELTCASWQVARGFSGIRLPLDNLGCGVHAIEVWLIQGGDVHVRAVPASIVVGDNGRVSVVGSADVAMMRSVFHRSPPTGFSYPKGADVVHGWIDGISIGAQETGWPLDVPYLEIRGWQFPPDINTAPVGWALALRNEKAVYYCGLESEDRLDVAESIGNILCRTCGYKANIWLSGVGSGTYVIDVIQRFKTGESISARTGWQISATSNATFSLHQGALESSGVKLLTLPGATSSMPRRKRSRKNANARMHRK